MFVINIKSLSENFLCDKSLNLQTVLFVSLHWGPNFPHTHWESPEPSTVLQTTWNVYSANESYRWGPSQTDWGTCTRIGTDIGLEMFCADYPVPFGWEIDIVISSSIFWSYQSTFFHLHKFPETGTGLDPEDSWTWLPIVVDYRGSSVNWVCLVMVSVFYSREDKALFF